MTVLMAGDAFLCDRPDCICNLPPLHGQNQNLRNLCSSSGRDTMLLRYTAAVMYTRHVVLDPSKVCVPHQPETCGRRHAGPHAAHHPTAEWCPGGWGGPPQPQQPTHHSALLHNVMLPSAVSLLLWLHTRADIHYERMDCLVT